MRLLLLLVLVLGGCAGPDLNAEPRMIPGTGEIEFVSLTSDVDDLVMTNGVQGGTHVWGAARVIGLDWRDITVTWTLIDESEDLATEPTTIRQALQPCTQADPNCTNGMGEIVAVTLVLNDPSGVRGDELSLLVEAYDEEGREASATSKVRPIALVIVE